MSSATEPKTDQTPVDTQRAQLPAATHAPATSMAVASGAPAYLTDTDAFEHLWRIAKGFADCGTMVPDAFRGKVSDCFIACQLALRLNVDPFMLMQNVYIVHGKPGFEAKLSIALLNASGKITGTVRYEFGGNGDEYGCAAYVEDAHTGQVVVGPKVSWKMVKAEGWNKNAETRGGGVILSKWNTMPDLMFHYRAATFLIRVHYPEVLMGLQTREELEDVPPPRPIMAAPRSLDTLADQLDVNKEPVEPVPGPAPVGDKTNPHQAAGDAAAAEVAAGPNGIGPALSPEQGYANARESLLYDLSLANTFRGCERALGNALPRLAPGSDGWAADKVLARKKEIESRRTSAKAEKENGGTPPETAPETSAVAEARAEAEIALARSFAERISAASHPVADPIALGTIRREVAAAVKGGAISDMAGKELVKRATVDTGV